MPPPFAPAKKYDGERENRVFKTGEAGLGYYIDAGPIQHVNLSDLLHPLEAAPPVPIELVKCVSDTEKGGRRSRPPPRADGGSVLARQG